MKKTLLIWDFDGVIADSEHLWVETWYNALLDKKNIKLSADEVQKYLTGMSIKTKQKILNERFGENTIDEEFLRYTHDRERIQIETALQGVPGVLEIFADTRFNHCIATGTLKDFAILKLKKVGLWQKYVDDHNCFTSDMVQNGKPAPDLFLFAASQMGYKPEDCIVIEDSISGIKAGIAANMKVIAFIGAEGNNTKAYADTCIKEGAVTAFNNMLDLHSFLKLEVK